jgi:hypothetical protein
MWFWTLFSSLGSDSRVISPRSILLSASLVIAAIAVGCDRGGDEIRTYSAPKEPPVIKPVEWATPAGWQELQPQEMQYAAYAVDAEHSDATLTVLALPRESNDLAPNVNRWERRLGLPPSPPEKVERMVSHVDVQGGHADVVDLSGTDAANNSTAPRRLLSAVVPHGTLTWFFTLQGSPDVVERQKSNFDAFVRSLTFKADQHAPAEPVHGQPALATAAQAQGAHGPGDGHDHHPGDGHDHGPAEPVAEKVTWGALPPGWTEDPTPRQMRVHTLFVEDGGKKGEVIVTRFPQNGVGPLLQNINRWRSQVGLEPTEDPKSNVPRDQSVFGGPGAAFDMEGPAKDGEPAKRQIVAMTAQAGNFWFVRFIGPKELVAAQQKAFEKILTDARFAGVPSEPQSPQQPSSSPSNQPSGSPR